MRASTPTSSSTDPVTDPELVGDPHCPVCHGFGYVRLDVPVGHPDFGQLFPCACRAAELRQRRAAALVAVNDLKGLERFTFENFRPEGHGLPVDRQDNLRRAYDVARAYALKPRGWLVIRGGYGCGKTHLAAAIANTCLDRGLPVLFVTVPDLLDHLRAAFAPTSEEPYAERFDEIRTAPLLILDDLGTEQSTPWALEKLFQLLNYRYLNRLPTVITTNRALEELEPRLRSRLADPDLVDIVTLLAPDYRQAGVDQAESDLNTLSLYSGMTLETFDLRQGELSREETDNLRRALALAHEYAAAPTGWLVFIGPYGSGKTHLAAGIANAWTREGHTALFVVVPDLLDHLRAAFNPQSPVSYDKRFEEVRRAPFLVLDDLGTENATPWAREKLYQLFNYRYVARQPTLITTALQVADLDAKLRTRLLDTSRCTIFALEVPPYRGQVAAPPSKSSRAGRPRKTAR